MGVEPKSLGELALLLVIQRRGQKNRFLHWYPCWPDPSTSNPRYDFGRRRPLVHCLAHLDCIAFSSGPWRNNANCSGPQGLESNRTSWALTWWLCRGSPCDGWPWSGPTLLLPTHVLELQPRFLVLSTGSQWLLFGGSRPLLGGKLRCVRTLRACFFTLVLLFRSLHGLAQYYWALARLSDPIANIPLPVFSFHPTPTEHTHPPSLPPPFLNCGLGFLLFPFSSSSFYVLILVLFPSRLGISLSLSFSCRFWDSLCICFPHYLLRRYCREV